jgi:hypothetical protein
MYAMPLAVVVVSFRTPDNLRRCVSAIESDQSKVAIYVADNQSDPAKFEAFAAQHDTIVGLPSTENPGFAAGVNRGAARAFADGATHVLVLNDDVFVRAGALARLQSAAGLRGAAAPYLAGRGDGEFRGGYIDWDTGIAGHREGSADYLCAACLMISREAWASTGPFDEGYFLYYEDVDWCVRAVARGVALAVVPEELAWHEGGASTGGGESPLVIYWWTRNRLRFIRKHRGFRAALAVATGSVARAAHRTRGGDGGVEEEVSDPAPQSVRSRKGRYRRASARVRGLVAGLTTSMG